MCHWCYPTPRFSCPSLDNIPKLRPCSCAEPRRMRGRTPGAVAPRPDLQLPAPRPSASQGVFKCQAVLARHLWAVLTATEVIGGNVTAFLRTRGTHTLTRTCGCTFAHTLTRAHAHTHACLGWGRAPLPHGGVGHWSLQEQSASLGARHAGSLARAGLGRIQRHTCDGTLSWRRPFL